MKIVIIPLAFFIFLFSGSSVLFAASLGIGYPDANGNRPFRISGCYPILFLLDVDMNIGLRRGGKKPSHSYITIPTLGLNGNKLERIHVCLNNEKHIAKNGLELFQKIAKKALEANCFKTTVYEEFEVIAFEFLPGNKRLVYKRHRKWFTPEGGDYPISSLSLTVSLDGYRPFVYERSVVPWEFDTEVHNLCFISSEPSPDQWPQYAEIIKHPL